MSHYKIFKRLILVTVWIIFYFILIDYYVSVISYGGFFIFWSPDFYYYFTGLAIVLGPATDYVLRKFFKWYTTRFYDVFFILIIAPVVLGFMMLAQW
jgi:hypothetical protein